MAFAARCLLLARRRGPQHIDSIEIAIFYSRISPCPPPKRIPAIERHAECAFVQHLAHSHAAAAHTHRPRSAVHTVRQHPIALNDITDAFYYFLLCAQTRRSFTFSIHKNHFIHYSVRCFLLFLCRFCRRREHAIYSNCGCYCWARLSFVADRRGRVSVCARALRSAHSSMRFTGRMRRANRTIRARSARASCHSPVSLRRAGRRGANHTKNPAPHFRVGRLFLPDRKFRLLRTGYNVLFMRHTNGEERQLEPPPSAHAANVTAKTFNRMVAVARFLLAHDVLIASTFRDIWNFVCPTVCCLGNPNGRRRRLTRAVRWPRPVRRLARVTLQLARMRTNSAHILRLFFFSPFHIQSAFFFAS